MCVCLQGACATDVRAQEAILGNALFLGRGRGFNDAHCGARRYIQRNGAGLVVFRCTVIARGLGHLSSRQARTPRPFSVFSFATRR